MAAPPNQEQIRRWSTTDVSSTTPLLRFFAADAQQLALWRRQSMKKKPKKK